MGFFSNFKKKAINEDDNKKLVNKNDVSSLNQSNNDVSVQASFEHKNASQVFFTDDTDKDTFLSENDRKRKEFYDKTANIPLPKVQDGNVQDVLELWNIPVSLKLSNDCITAEEIDEINFDIEIPEGYEKAEVESFKRITRNTIQQLTDLLNSREKHVADLATVIDRLQVDLENKKFQNEVANGINIMTTEEDDGLEQENFELTIALKEANKEIDRLNNQIENGGSFITEVSAEEQRQVELLADKVSIISREKDELLDEVYSLKNTLASYVENEELPNLSQLNTQSGSHFSSYSEENDDDLLPMYEDDDITNDVLPEIDTSIANDNSITINPNNRENSVFFFDENESISEFIENNKENFEINDNNDSENTGFSFNDYDDVEKLMKETMND